MEAADGPFQVYLRYASQVHDTCQLGDLMPYFSQARIAQIRAEARKGDTDTFIEKGVVRLRRVVPRQVTLVKQSIDGRRCTLALTGTRRDDRGYSTRTVTVQGTACLVLEKDVWKVDSESWPPPTP